MSLDVLKGFFQESALSSVGSILAKVDNLLKYFDNYRLKDGESARNAAIDALIKVIEEEKTK